MSNPSPAPALAYASVVLNPLRKKVYYVSALPGQNGIDWGFTDKIEGYPSRLPGDNTTVRLDAAKPLTPYWQARFAAYCRAVNRTASFVTVPRFSS